MRRPWLVLGCAGLIGTAARPVGAGTTAEVEGGAYGGVASGEWACGPTARVQYGGLGARGSVRLGQAPPLASGEPGLPRGVSVGAGVAGEARGYRLLDCRRDPCEASDRRVPPDGLVGAATLTGGYDGEHVGVRAGALVGQRYRDSDDRSPGWQVAPELHLRLGRLDRVRGEVGVGSYSVDTMLRPGAYAGLGLPVGASVDLTARVGYHQVIDGELGPRLDLAGRWGLGQVVSLTGGAGASYSPTVGRLDPHARLGVAASF